MAYDLLFAPGRSFMDAGAGRFGPIGLHTAIRRRLK